MCDIIEMFLLLDWAVMIACPILGSELPWFASMVALSSRGNTAIVPYSGAHLGWIVKDVACINHIRGAQ
jgi:hypothetical protein